MMRVCGMNYYPQIPLGQPSQMQPLCEKTATTPPSSPINNRKPLQAIANNRQLPPPPFLLPFCAPLRPPPSGTPDKPLQTTANHRQPPQTSAKNPACLTTNGVLKTHFSRLAAYLISCAQKMCQSSRLFRSTAPGFTLPSSGMPSASRIVLRTSSPWM